MNPLSSLRRVLAAPSRNLSWPLLAGLAALPLSAGALQREAPVHPADDTRPAHGLIVRLSGDDARIQSAPSARAAAETALAARQEAATALGRAGLAGWNARAMSGRTLLVSPAQVLTPEAAREASQRLAATPGVAWVAPNVRERRQQAGAPLTTNDPYFSQQWWLQAVAGSDSDALAERRRGVPGLQTAWAAGTGSGGVRIAVLDSGYTDHPELRTRVRPGYDFVSEVEYANDGNGRDADPHDPGDWVSDADRRNHPALFGDCAVTPSSWHGTAILGQLAAQTGNASGMAAARWSGDVLAVRVAGKCGATVADIVDGIRWAAGLPVDGVPDNPTPARVISLSFGGDAACSPAYQEAIDDVARVGAVVVASAGNDSGAVSRPANCRGVVAVAALNRDGFKAYYSNFGPEVTVSTVGGDYQEEGRWGPMLGDGGLLSLYNDGAQGPGVAQYALFAGTSFAAPIVSATAALMLDANPQLSAEQLIDGLRRSARPHVGSTVLPVCSADTPTRCICAEGQCGDGILDATEALRYAANPTAYAVQAWNVPVLDNAELRSAIALGSDTEPSEQSAGLASTDAGGGGAMSLAWLAALLAAVLAAARVVRRPR
ncbi:S8 family serine peptidase [Caldimonas sp. KR1-144]|uniref:S8 family serine peptidase n=1 Tax=Caldimonas sp. KR1-144 TaxID=3400911 RepID=UPI003C062D52